MKLIPLVAALGALVTSAALAQNTPMARSDTSFLSDAAHAGLMEIEGSKIAVQKAVHPKIKEFAQQVIDDHLKAHQDLQALAANKGVKLPTEPSMMQRAKLKLLEAGDGAAFDRRYADSIGVDAHKDAVELFRKAAQSARDADVKAFAAKALPTLQHHLEMARSLQREARAEGNAHAPTDRKL